MIRSLAVPLASDGAEETLLGMSPVLVEDAELWWMHDLGSQPRYQVTIRLREGEQILDERCDLVGLRTIALDRSEDPEGGRHFASFSMEPRYLLGERLGCPLTCSSDP
jgi:beta-galactosidase/beta-glucuronidase